MKKILALGLILALTLSLGSAALAAEIPEGWTPADGARGVIPEGWTAADGARDLPEAEDVTALPLPETFVGTITVDGVELDLTGIPGAPTGYVPMRAICEAAGGMVDYYPEDNEALFFLGDNSVVVSFTNLSVSVAFEAVEGVTAYLDPAGYTFLPVAHLATLKDIKVDDNLELDVIRYDITTIPERTEVEALAYAIMDAAETGKLMQLDAQTMEENYGFHMDAYDELVAYQPMMTAQPTTIVIAQVKEGQMSTAKEDFQAYLEAVKGTLGFYPATAEALEKAQTVESADGQHLMLVSTWESNDQAVALFQDAFPGK